MRPVRTRVPGDSPSPFMHAAAAIVVALRWRLEFAIEFLLLLGRKQGMHARARLMHLFAPLVLKLLTQVHNLGAGFVYNLEDLVALRRRQFQFVLHPRDERLMRNAQPSIAIG